MFSPPRACSYICDEFLIYPSTVRGVGGACNALRRDSESGTGKASKGVFGALRWFDPGKVFLFVYVIKYLKNTPYAEAHLIRKQSFKQDENDIKLSLNRR